MANTNVASIGLKAKTGRAIAVALQGPAAAPQLIKRMELVLTDPCIPQTFQPYHEVMELPWLESQKKVKPFIRAIEKVAAKALGELVREIESEGLQVVGVGIVGGADRDLAKLGGYHIRAHAAEGLLFRQVLEFAAQANKLSYRTFVEKVLLTQAASELGLSPPTLNTRLGSLGSALGPPWRADQRVAAAAAWLSFPN
jgi:hypothetical protein